MDALILSLGTGGGHNAAGRAIQEALEERGHRAVFLNPYDLLGGESSKKIDNIYIKLAQRLPWLFGAIYQLGNLYRHLPWHSPVFLCNRKMAPVLKEYLDKNHCDVIISTHIFSGEIIATMHELGLKLPGTVFVATDYTCVPFSEETFCDSLVIASGLLTEEYISHGIEGERIIPAGIPVSSQFREGPSKQVAKAMAGLDPEKSYILLAGGSMGAGGLIKTVGLLLKWCRGRDYIPVVVSGNNKRLQKKLSRRFSGRIILIGYTDRLHIYLRACDAYITKPGGLSSTEAAVMGIPIIHMNRIPGCETKNMRFFSELGMSISAKNTKESLFSALDRAVSSDGALKMRLLQKKYINPDAAGDIALICEGLAAKKRCRRTALAESESGMEVVNA